MNTQTLSTTSLVRAVEDALGVVSIITPDVSFCFQSARLHACQRENEIIIMTHDSMTDLHIALADIKQVEALFCKDGTIEYEITTESSNIVIDLEPAGQKS